MDKNPFLGLGRRPDRVYGRKEELKECMDFVRSDSNIVFVSGEQGIGKTTMMDLLQHECERQGMVTAHIAKNILKTKKLTTQKYGFLIISKI
ncbi:ATP-binding protein [Candidatus Micrarchaeota archaeon]|nr:ATP-binding protein [Candidatus Micrarchaeota archaeon]